MSLFARACVTCAWHASCLGRGEGEEGWLEARKGRVLGVFKRKKMGMMSSYTAYSTKGTRMVVN